MSHKTVAQHKISELSTLFSDIAGPTQVSSRFEAYDLVFATSAPFEERDEQEMLLIFKIKSRTDSIPVVIGSRIDTNHLRIYVRAGASAHNVTRELVDIAVGAEAHQRELELATA